LIGKVHFHRFWHPRPTVWRGCLFHCVDFWREVPGIAKAFTGLTRELTAESPAHRCAMNL
jgi:hypothetical protein